MPFWAEKVGVFDPATSFFSQVDIFATGEFFGWTYGGGVLVPSGKIVFVPHHANHVGVFDPESSIFETVDISSTISMDYKYFGAVLTPNGNVVFIPWVAGNVGVFDPATSAFSVVDITTSRYDYFGGSQSENITLHL